MIKLFTLAGVTFDDRQELIKKLKFREELKVEKYDFEGEDAFSIKKLNGEQIGNIRKNDIDKMNEIYDRITECHVMGTSAFLNEDGKTLISCQIGVNYE